MNFEVQCTHEMLYLKAIRLNRNCNTLLFQSPNTFFFQSTFLKIDILNNKLDSYGRAVLNPSLLLQSAGEMGRGITNDWAGLQSF